MKNPKLFHAKGLYNFVTSLLLGIVCLGEAISQEIPPIQIFSPKDYAAENQNWAISQGTDRQIYVANNKGLLTYNGAFWTLYNSPNQTIMRSVKANNNRIYTGAYMDFGYWEADSTNTLQYISIVKTKNIKVREDEEFWGIAISEDYIAFQSFESIYILNAQNFDYKTIKASNRINKLYKVNNGIYFQDDTNGIFKIINGKAYLEIASKDYEYDEIITMYEDAGELVLITKTLGAIHYKKTDNQWTRTKVNDSWALDKTVYSATQLKDGSVLIGTISNGIVQLNGKGETILEINQSKGLSNNTVLSVFEDRDGNVWLGMDNGINVINLQSPYKVYTDKLGQLGTVYTACIFENQLYLGTNQGLFLKPRGSGSGFSLVSGTKGQVWSLNVINNTLFCGHDKGTLTVKGNKSQLISSVRGTWGVKEVPNQSDLLLQGNYKGLSVLELKNGVWSFRNTIEGFEISSRYFEFSGINSLLVSHEYKGVYQLGISDDLRAVKEVKKLDIPSGMKSSIQNYYDDILYTYNEGVFKYQAETRTFLKDSLLSSLISSDQFYSGKLIIDEKTDRLWAFSKNSIIYAEPGIMTDRLNFYSIPVPSELRASKAGFESVLYLERSKYLFGTTTGYFIIDLEKLDFREHQIKLNTASVHSGQKAEKFLPIDYDEGLLLSNEENSLRFRYGVSSYSSFSPTLYQYKLDGIYNQWSKWSKEPEVTFENLPYGNYTFNVKAKTGNVDTANTLSYTFTIDKPWYLKPLAMVFYVLAFLLLVFVLHLANRRYYKKQRQKLLAEQERSRELERLENQRQIVEFKNDNLRLDIENKNRELGMATMNLVKRNELLNEIKLALTKVRTTDDVKPVVKRINSNLNDSSDWKLFEEAFNNVDKDFMKRIKSLHPSVTHNDLRLCAYLRLNLSSKEIAPLLNISHKSVEVKRYRLRKKMGLDHDRSLTNYILDL